MIVPQGSAPKELDRLLDKHQRLLLGAPGGVSGPPRIGSSRLGVQKPSKNLYNLAYPKLCFEGALASKRSVFERSSFLLL